MKLIELFLAEANVVNVDFVDRACAALAGRVADPRAKQWFTRKLRRYLLNAEALLEPARAEQDLPDWASREVAAGRPVYYVNSNSPAVIDLLSRMEHIADWFEALSGAATRPATNSVEQQDQRDAAKHLEKLAKYEVDQIEKIAEDWFAAVGSRVGATKAGVQVQHRFPDGHYVVTYEDRDAYVADGNELQNCMRGGTYFDQVQRGTQHVYVIRSPADAPIVAIRCATGVAEIKGKNNKPPADKYIPYVKELLNRIGLPPESGAAADLAGVGLAGSPQGRYGSIREVAESVLKFADGYEVKVHDKQYFLFGSGDAVLAQFHDTDPLRMPHANASAVKHIMAFAEHLGRTIAKNDLRGAGIYERDGRHAALVEVADLEETFEDGSRLMSLPRYERLPNEQTGPVISWSGTTSADPEGTTMFYFDARDDRQPYLRFFVVGDRATRLYSLYGNQHTEQPRGHLIDFLNRRRLVPDTTFIPLGILVHAGVAVGWEGGEAHLEGQTKIRRYDNVIKAEDQHGKVDLMADHEGRFTSHSKSRQPTTVTKDLVSFLQRHAIKVGGDAANYLVTENIWSRDGKYGRTPAVGEPYLRTRQGQWYYCDDQWYYLVRDDDWVIRAKLHQPATPFNSGTSIESQDRRGWASNVSGALVDLLNKAKPDVDDTVEQAAMFDTFYDKDTERWVGPQEVDAPFVAPNGIQVALLDIGRERRAIFFDGQQEIARWQFGRHGWQEPSLRWTAEGRLRDVAHAMLALAREHQIEPSMDMARLGIRRLNGELSAFPNIDFDDITTWTARDFRDAISIWGADDDTIAARLREVDLGSAQWSYGRSAAPELRLRQAGPIDLFLSGEIGGAALEAALREGVLRLLADTAKVAGDMNMNTVRVAGTDDRKRLMGLIKKLRLGDEAKRILGPLKLRQV